MTAVTTVTAATTTATDDVARFRDLLAAEWTKLWALRSTRVVLPLLALAVIGLNLFDAIGHLRFLEGIQATPGDGWEPGSLDSAFTLNASLVLLLAAGSIGASTVVSELSSGLVRTTFVAVPDRRSVMAAKAVVVTTVFAVLGAVVASLSFGISQAILDGEGFGAPITYPGAWRVVVASAVLAPVAALVGMAVGAVVRHTATAMGVTLFLLGVLPTFLSDRYATAARVRYALPLPAWQRLTDTNPFGMNLQYEPSIMSSWIVLAAWALLAATVAVVVLRRGDV